MKINRSLLLLFALAGMLPPVIMRIIAWYNEMPLSDWPGFLGGVLTSVTSTVIISYSVVKVLLWLQINHPWRNGVLKRLFLEIILTTLTACALITLLTLLSHTIRPKADLESAIFNYLIIAVIMNFVLVAITEGIFFFRQWKHAAVEAESYKKEHILAQFENLKNQVNPHFLFNSLNTLSDLIDKDKEISKTFLDNLATVYRYVLQHKDDELVSVKTELDFIKTYAELLKQRHGDRINFYFDISTEDLKKGIPPMALQMLVENAVKHNVASRKKPLTINIESKENALVIKNNLQRKKNVISTGVGLENIKKRYKYLSDREIEIIEYLTSFEVHLPILTMELNVKR